MALMKIINDKEKVEEIQKRLSEDPYIVINRDEKDERIHVNVKKSVKDALAKYLLKNEKELKNMNITSRNKLIALIIEEWCKKNNLKIDD